MIEGTVTFKPLKAGTIAVELEVADTEENLLVLSRMHKKKGHLLSETEMEALPQDRFFLLLDIQAKCQQVQDMITAELHPIPISTPRVLTFPDEKSAKDYMAADILDGSIYVPPVQPINTAEVMEKFDKVITGLGGEWVQAPDELEVKYDSKVDKMAPANEFYGEEKKDAD